MTRLRKSISSIDSNNFKKRDMELRNIKYGALDFNYKTPETYRYFIRYGIRLKYIQLDDWKDGIFNIDKIKIPTEKVVGVYYLFEYGEDDNNIKRAIANVTIYNSAYNIRPLIHYYYNDMYDAHPPIESFGRIKRWCPIEVINMKNVDEVFCNG